MKHKKYIRKYNGDIKLTPQKYEGHISKHPLYITWRMMNVRCLDDRHQSYHRYGGRGIEVCKEWRWDNEKGFNNFIECVGDRPYKTTLDRIDNDGHYSPTNVRWSNKKVQQNNMGLGANNKTGIMGVSNVRDRDLYHLQISVYGETVYVGTFYKKENDKAKKTI